MGCEECKHGIKGCLWQKEEGVKFDLAAVEMQIPSRVNSKQIRIQLSYSNCFLA